MAKGRKEILRLERLSGRLADPECSELVAMLLGKLTPKEKVRPGLVMLVRGRHTLSSSFEKSSLCCYALCSTPLSACDSNVTELDSRRSWVPYLPEKKTDQSPKIEHKYGCIRVYQGDGITAMEGMEECVFFSWDENTFGRCLNGRLPLLQMSVEKHVMEEFKEAALDPRKVTRSEQLTAKLMVRSGHSLPGKKPVGV